MNKIDPDVITAHASKTSKISLGLFEAHTSVLIPLMVIPAMLFLTIFSWGLFLKVLYLCLGAVVVLIILERRGITLATGIKRMRTKLVSRNRYSSSRARMARRRKLNSFGK